MNYDADAACQNKTCQNKTGDSNNTSEISFSRLSSRPYMSSLVSDVLELEAFVSIR